MVFTALNDKRYYLFLCKNLYGDVKSQELRKHKYLSKCLAKAEKVLSKDNSIRNLTVRDYYKALLNTDVNYNVINAA
jgi:hypothetical protein